MFIVLGLMFCGIFAGYVLRGAGFLGFLSKGISIAIYLLLFFLGLQIGANKELITNLPVLGWRSFFIALMVVLGSCLAAKTVFYFFFRKDKLFVDSEKTVSEKNAENSGLDAIKGSLVVVGYFVFGVISGFILFKYNFLPDILLEGKVAQIVLYLLMIQVGMSIGCDKNLGIILKGIRPKLLLVPAATIIGTLLFAALASLIIDRWNFNQVMAVGSGFAYYSLSSILITQLQEPIVGMQQAVELGTVALMTNVIREIFALLGAPLFYKYFGQFAPICVGGATTMDTTLPIISKVCGKELVFLSVFHGVLVDFSVPILVSFFLIS